MPWAGPTSRSSAGWPALAVRVVVGSSWQAPWRPCGPSVRPRWRRRARTRAAHVADSVVLVQIANFEQGPSGPVEIGHIKGVWRDLGREVGTRGGGLRRIEIAPGHFSTPAHEHGGDEEIFFVLGGEGLLWQDGDTYVVGAGDCIVHRP